MKRRHFLKLSGLGTGSAIVGSSVAAFLAACNKSSVNMVGKNTTDMMGGGGMMGYPVIVTEGNYTRLLPVANEMGTSGTLTAQNTIANIKGSNVNVLGYQANNILGPTMRLNSGSTGSFNLQNKLSASTNIHWHGLKVPANMDGYPDDVANANGSFNYQFTVNQRAGLYWYHPHTDSGAGKQVFQGLAGLFIVNDAEEAALNLPNGINEIPLVIQDKRISSSAITYAPSMMDVMTGYMGDSVIVNGVWSPYKEVPTRYYRVRILNGSNARIYNLALSNNADMVIIGNDAGLLKNPSTVKSVLLAPGERLDVLVNFSGLSAGTELYLENRVFAGAGSSQGKQAFRIMKFKVTTVVADTFSVPATLSKITTLNAASSVATRNFDISNSGMMGGMQHTINGKVFSASRIDETVKANTNEIWVFDNTKGSEPHPMHIHGVQFQILERTGGSNGLIASEAGWKDTMLVLPKEKVKVIIPFGNITGKFVFHCHNLEHEDDGMMLQYQLR